MKFTAKFIHRSLSPYYRTVYADDINEANYTASRYVKKGYLLATVTQKE